VNWLASPWCVAEAMMARERGKPVFLLATADVADSRQVKLPQDENGPPQIPDFLKDTQFISLSGKTEEQALDELCRGLTEAGLRDDFRLPKLNFNTGFLELIDLICGFVFSRPAWHYACGV
jgi:hypothetical protein